MQCFKRNKSDLVHVAWTEYFTFTLLLYFDVLGTNRGPQTEYNTYNSIHDTYAQQQSHTLHYRNTSDTLAQRGKLTTLSPRSGLTDPAERGLAGL